MTTKKILNLLKDLMLTISVFIVFILLSPKIIPNKPPKLGQIIDQDMSAERFLFSLSITIIVIFIYKKMTKKGEVDKKDATEKEFQEEKKGKELRRLETQTEQELEENDKQKQYIKNYHLIEKNNGITPIKGNEIGEILIDRKNNIIKIQIKQITQPQIIDSFEGLIICKNSKYTIGETEINGGVFEIDKISPNNNYKIFINNNRQSIQIECSEADLQIYKNKQITAEEYKDLYTRSLYGGFFSIKED